MVNNIMYVLVFFLLCIDFVIKIKEREGNFSFIIRLEIFLLFFWGEKKRN